MDIMHFFCGTMTIQISSADCPALLNALTEASVEIWNVLYLDTLTVSVTVRRADLRRIEKLVQRKGGYMKVCNRAGIFWYIPYALKRPILVAGICFILCLSFYLPGKILFVHVEGNSAVPDKLILEKAESFGICFGANREDVRSEKVKNALLESISQLKWAGVNTKGCVATISVRERAHEARETIRYAVGSLVASRDGIIDSCVVTKGNLLCKVGQAVSAGDVLVSGYTDCGIVIQATHALGEIFARTNRELTVIAPADYIKRGELISKSQRISLVFGKNQYYFSKDSGILDTSCGKMTKEYQLALPGGFELPVAIVIETWYNYNMEVISVSAEAAHGDMEQEAQRYLQSLMVSGEILSSDVCVSRKEEAFVLHGSYVCREMIGRIRNEESIDYDGQRN